MTDVQVGQVVAKRTVRLDRETLVRYAGASGDFNPIHYRDDVAHKVGLPGVLAHGMLTMALAVETVMPWLGDPARIISYSSRFSRPVVVDADAGAEVRIVATVADIKDDSWRIDFQVTSGDVTVLTKVQLHVHPSGQ